MKILTGKSLLPSLCQREVSYPSLAKRGEGRFLKGVSIPMNLLSLIAENNLTGRYFAGKCQRKGRKDMTVLPLCFGLLLN
jgi:hypothetical protein